MFSHIMFQLYQIYGVETRVAVNLERCYLHGLPPQIYACVTDLGLNHFDERKSMDNFAVAKQIRTIEIYEMLTHNHAGEGFHRLDS